MRLLREVFFFGVGGVLGFIVDTAVLYAFRGYLGLFNARLFSFFVAVIVTWVFNRKVTFGNRPSELRLRKEFLIYLILMSVGGAFNYGLYAFLVSSYLVVNTFPVIGVAAGSLAGMLVNLTTSRLLLYRAASSSKPGV